MERFTVGFTLRVILFTRTLRVLFGAFSCRMYGLILGRNERRSPRCATELRAAWPWKMQGPEPKMTAPVWEFPKN